MAESHKLSVIVHENDEVTVRDGRGVTLLCRDCRFSGWLSEWERGRYTHPRTCLRHSGGADMTDGDRVWLNIRDSWNHDRIAPTWRGNYPFCHRKNHDGNCEDYVKAQPLRWWGNFWLKLLRREWRTRRMRP